MSSGLCESVGMRDGISFTVSSGERQRLHAIVSDPKSPQKHVWRSRIILLSDDDLGTMAIMAATGKSKTCVWRWQERFMEQGIDGLLRDKTRPPGIAPVASERVAEVVRLTQAPPPHEATHWTLRAMAKAVGMAASTVQGIWKAHGLSPHRWRQFKLSNDPAFVEFVEYTLARWDYQYPYDVALWATISDFPYSWPLWQRYSTKFVTTNLVSYCKVFRVPYWLLTRWYKSNDGRPARVSPPLGGNP